MWSWGKTSTSARDSLPVITTVRRNTKRSLKTAYSLAAIARSLPRCALDREHTLPQARQCGRRYRHRPWSTTPRIRCIARTGPRSGSRKLTQRRTMTSTRCRGISSRALLLWYMWELTRVWFGGTRHVWHYRLRWRGERDPYSVGGAEAPGVSRL